VSTVPGDLRPSLTNSSSFDSHRFAASENRLIIVSSHADPPAYGSEALTVGSESLVSRTDHWPPRVDASIEIAVVRNCSVPDLLPRTRRLHVKGHCGEVSDRQTPNASHDIAYVEG
jgi:hypothetical protein